MFCFQLKKQIRGLCAHLFPCAMGKRGSDGALVKRPASNVSSIEGALLSEVVVAELEATRNINDFRKRARKLGLVTQHRNSDGQWRDRARADVLDECRRRLAELHGPTEVAASSSACASQASQASFPDIPFGSALDAPGPVPFAVRRSLAGGDDATGEAQVSVLFADNVNFIKDTNSFCKAAVKLGLTVQVKSGDGKGCTRRGKADIVEEYNKKVAEYKRISEEYKKKLSSLNLWPSAAPARKNCLFRYGFSVRPGHCHHQQEAAVPVGVPSPKRRR